MVLLEYLMTLNYICYGKLTLKVVDPCIRKETIILDDNSYTLSYHCHPGSKWLDEKKTLHLGSLRISSLVTSNLLVGRTDRI